MRRTAHVLVAVTSILTALFIVEAPAAHGVAATGGGTAVIDIGFVDRMMYDTPMRTFIDVVKAHKGPDGHDGDEWFDWSTDLYTAPLIGNTGRTFNFTDSCRRHDFGYRNSKLLDQRYGSNQYWNHMTRKRVDQQFLADMKASCRSQWTVNRPTCIAWAYTFYSAVRVAGGP